MAPSSGTRCSFEGSIGRECIIEAMTRTLLALMLAVVALTAGLAFAASPSASAHVDSAADCAHRFGFARTPVPVAKTTGGQQVLATVKWGYTTGLCYLILDDDAVQTLQAHPPVVSPKAPTSSDQAAANRCHNAHSPTHGFARTPVPVAKTTGGQQVLATVKWGYTRGLCYLTLDDDAVQTLQAHPPPDPTTVELPVSTNTHSRIAAAFRHFCHLQADNTAFCMGDQGFRFYGRALTGAPDGEFTSISSGSIHACGIRNDGALECWGDDRWWPYRAPDGQFAAVAAGAWYSCGLRTGGTVECWGHKGEDGKLVDDERLDAPDGQFTAISASAEFTCGLRAEGTVQCWGVDPYGWGTLEAPTGRFSTISAGGRHACGLQTDNTIACWGDNRVGQANPPTGRFAAVSAGYSHSCGLRVEGTVECWGSNFHQQSAAPGGLFTEISAGGVLSCGLRPSQITVCWGDIKYPFSFSGEIDVHVFYCASESAEYSDADLRREVSEIYANVGEFYREQSSGLATLNFIPGGVVSPDGIQWNGDILDEAQECRSEINQLGDYPQSLVLVDLAPRSVGGFATKSGSNSTAYSPTLEARHSNACSPLSPTARVRSLAFKTSCSDYEGYYSTIVHEIGHSVFNLGHPVDCSVMSYICHDATTIGCVSGLQLGWPKFEEECSQERQRGSESHPVFVVVREGWASPPYGTFYCGLRTDQTIACWGYDSHLIGNPPSGTFTDFALGQSFACGLRTNQTIACWGRNDYGQASPPSGTFVSIRAQPFYSCGTRTTGATVCWGDQTIGYVKSYTPGGRFTAISAGTLHWCGLRDDQTIACGGQDSSQETIPPRGRFTHVFAHSTYSCGVDLQQNLICWGGYDIGAAVSAESQFTAITAGVFHACGLRTDQTIACWIHGQNQSHVRYGQAFDQEVAPSGEFTAVSAGDTHTCGLRTDQTIACWGDNRSGQADPPDGQFTAVSARGSTTCGLRTDQTIACWGNDSFGKADPPDGQFTAVSLGGGHACALRTDGTVTCWGQNASGETVAPAGHFINIATGWWHSCGLRIDRTTITCWGQVPD